MLIDSKSAAPSAEVHCKSYCPLPCKCAAFQALLGTCGAKARSQVRVLHTYVKLGKQYLVCL